MKKKSQGSEVLVEESKQGEPIINIQTKPNLDIAEVQSIKPFVVPKSYYPIQRNYNRPKHQTLQSPLNKLHQRKQSLNHQKLMNKFNMYN